MQNKTTPIVQIIDNQIVTTSLDVAEFFNKQHKDALRAIRNLEISDDFRRRNFAPCEIIRNIPLQGEKNMPAYNLTRDGFVILVMGFTGKVAMQFKIVYIEAFNAMEAALRDKAQH